MAESSVPSQPGGEHPIPPEIPAKDVDPKDQQTLSHKILSRMWLILFLALVILVICGGIIFHGRQSTNITGIKNASYIMTKNDFGKTLQTRPGDSIILHLDLDKNLTETLSIDNTNMLFVQHPLTYNPTTNIFDTIVQTRVPGIAKVSVLGRPKCHQHAMCPQYIILEFTMNVKTQQ